MPEGIYLGFDFGFKRIGLAVGQLLTGSASPLATLEANQGVPNWHNLRIIIERWCPQALIVGLPTAIDNKELYTTSAAKSFARKLGRQYGLPVHLVDERLTTKEARAYLFASGGYRKIKKADVDSIAACIILEQWLQNS